MTVTTVYADTSDGRIQSFGATYTDVRAGTSLAVNTTSTNTFTGQALAGSYFCWEGFLNFDTSSIDDADAVSDVDFSLYGHSNNSATDFIINCYARDWGDTLETSDWVAGADLGSLTLLATFDTTGWVTTGYNLFTESGTAFQSAINLTGKTRLLLASNRHAAGNTPVGREDIEWKSADNTGTTQDPKLVITHEAPAAKALPLFRRPVYVWNTGV